MNSSTHEIYEIVILGTGPAGLQAAIHAARAKASVLVMGREYKSSLYKAHVENYCCLSGVSGASLLMQGVEQAKAAPDLLLEGFDHLLQHFGIEFFNGFSALDKSVDGCIGVVIARH